MEKNVILTTDIRPEDCLIEKPKIRTYGPYNLPIDEIVQKYKTGKGSYVLANEYKKYNPNITHNAIISLLSKEGVLRKAKKRAVSNSEIYEKYQELKSLRKTADYYGIGSSSVGRSVYKFKNSKQAKAYPVLEEKLIIPKPEKNQECNVIYRQSYKYNTLGKEFNIGQSIVSGYADMSLNYKEKFTLRH